MNTNIIAKIDSGCKRTVCIELSDMHVGA